MDWDAFIACKRARVRRHHRSRIGLAYLQHDYGEGHGQTRHAAEERAGTNELHDRDEEGG